MVQLAEIAQQAGFQKKQKHTRGHCVVRNVWDRKPLRIVANGVEHGQSGEMRPSGLCLLDDATTANDLRPRRLTPPRTSCAPVPADRAWESSQREEAVAAAAAVVVL